MSCGGTKPTLTQTELTKRFEDQKILSRQNRRLQDFLAETDTKFKPTPIEGSHLKEGDLLLIRLPSDLSYSLPFQHLLWVATDPTDSQLKTLSIFPNKNLSFTPISSPMTEGKTRILHLRLKDRDLAKKSSKMISDLWKLKMESGQPILYDDELDFRDHKRLTSLEVAQVALEMGSEGQFKISDRIEDLEIDPRFEIKNEWRDPKSIREMRMREAIQNQIEYWMEELAYRPFPPVSPLEDLLFKQLTQITASSPKSLTYPELIAALEDFRKSDLVLFQDRKTRNQSVMHRQFRADLKILRQKAKQQAAPKDPNAGTKYPALETELKN
jgi:hypothetical protein